VAALRASAPIVAQIRDAALRPEYARMLAGWLGMEFDAVRQAVTSASRALGSGGNGGRRPDAGRAGEPMVPGPQRDERGGGGARGPSRARPDGPDRADPVARLQRNVLEAVLQHPGMVDAAVFDVLPAEAFSVPALRAVHEAIRAAGGAGAVAEANGENAWLERVREEAAGPVSGLVTELAVTPLPEDRPDALEDYVRGVVNGLVDLGLTRQVADARGRLQRMDPEKDADVYQAAFAELVALEGTRRALRSRD